MHCYRSQLISNGAGPIPYTGPDIQDPDIQDPDIMDKAAARELAAIEQKRRECDEQHARL